mmetsp:Transcript_53890/g.65055  ORF Transcript_53890/g.65055 Transcript_53890/m.65055 type:complete len:535 (-) Transcript_53890:215-1819(-)
MGPAASYITRRANAVAEANNAPVQREAHNHAQFNRDNEEITRGTPSMMDGGAPSPYNRPSPPVNTARDSRDTQDSSDSERPVRDDDGVFRSSQHYSKTRQVTDITPPDEQAVTPLCILSFCVLAILGIAGGVAIGFVISKKKPKIPIISDNASDIPLPQHNFSIPDTPSFGETLSLSYSGDIFTTHSINKIFTYNLSIDSFVGDLQSSHHHSFGLPDDTHIKMIQISMDGSIMVCLSQNSASTSIHSYEMKSGEMAWKQREDISIGQGNNIDEETRHEALSMAIDEIAERTVWTLNDVVTVYKYSTMEQYNLGDLDDGEHFKEVSLSSDGNVLTVAVTHGVQIYRHDGRSGEWLREDIPDNDEDVATSSVHVVLSRPEPDVEYHLAIGEAGFEHGRGRCRVLVSTAAGEWVPLGEFFKEEVEDNDDGVISNNTQFDNETQIEESPTNERRRRRLLEMGFGQIVRLSADAKFIAVLLGDHNGAEVYQRDATDTKWMLRRSFGITGGGYKSLDFSGDGKVLALATHRGAVEVYDNF